MSDGKMFRPIPIVRYTAERRTGRGCIRNKFGLLRKAQLNAIVLCCTLFCCCGWEKKLTFEEKTGHSRVEIYQPFPINEAGISVILVENGRTVTLLERRADTFLEFVDVLWSDQESVAVYACGAVEVAYDLRVQKPIPFSVLRSRVAQHIRAAYQVPRNIVGEDAVFSWACFDGREEFLKRYPSAKGR